MAAQFARSVGQLAFSLRTDTTGCCLLAHSYIGYVAMETIDRRTLLSAFGVIALTPLFAKPGDELEPKLAPVILPPGGNHYAYATGVAAKVAPCKVSSADSRGAFSAFENITPPKQGRRCTCIIVRTNGSMSRRASLFLKSMASERKSSVPEEVFLDRAEYHTVGQIPEPKMLFLSC